MSAEIPRGDNDCEPHAAHDSSAQKVDEENLSSAGAGLKDVFFSRRYALKAWGWIAVSAAGLTVIDAIHSRDHSSRPDQGDAASDGRQISADEYAELLSSISLMKAVCFPEIKVEIRPNEIARSTHEFGWSLQEARLGRYSRSEFTAETLTVIRNGLRFLNDPEWQDSSVAIDSATFLLESLHTTPGQQINVGIDFGVDEDDVLLIENVIHTFNGYAAISELVLENVDDVQTADVFCDNWCDSGRRLAYSLFPVFVSYELQLDELSKESQLLELRSNLKLAVRFSTALTKKFPNKSQHFAKVAKSCQRRLDTFDALRARDGKRIADILRQSLDIE